MSNETKWNETPSNGWVKELDTDSLNLIRRFKPTVLSEMLDEVETERSLAVSDYCKFLDTYDVDENQHFFSAKVAIDGVPLAGAKEYLVPEIFAVSVARSKNIAVLEAVYNGEWADKHLKLAARRHIDRIRDALYDRGGTVLKCFVTFRHNSNALLKTKPEAEPKVQAVRLPQSLHAQIFGT